jgi:diaminopimelate decarboxylase
MNLSWDRLNSISADYGDSFFLLDLGRFEQNYREFLTAFRTHYPNSQIAYSYKTNYTPRLCQRVDALGGYAEVVSGMEYQLALRLGVSPGRIIFNGPYKDRDDLQCALACGSIVNLDSLDELQLVESLARQMPNETLHVGLRCNFAMGSEPISRFGFDVEGDTLGVALGRLGRLHNCCAVGLHCHFSTGHRSVESFVARTRRLVELSSLHFTSRLPRLINIGGGYFGNVSAEFGRSFGTPVPTVEQYAVAIAREVVDAFGTDGPQLVLEPGTALTADTMSFVAKIVGLKTVRGRHVALASGSIHNIKPTLHRKNMPMRVFHRNRDAAWPAATGYDIVGYTCMEHDCLHEGYEGSLDRDDYLVFGNVGAYTTVMKPPFIRPSPAIVAWEDRGSAVQLIKRRETLDDVFATYVF